MLWRAQYKTVLAAVCFGATLPAVAAAQPLPHQDFISAEWQAFIEFCTPFMRDPLASRDALPTSGPNLTVATVGDNLSFEYTESDPSLERDLAVYIWDEGEIIEFHCDLMRSTETYQKDTDGIARDLTALLSQTEGVNVSGGLVDYISFDGFDASLAESPELRAYAFRISGVFPGEMTILEADVTYYGFNLFVSARFIRETGLR